MVLCRGVQGLGSCSTLFGVSRSAPHQMAAAAGIYSSQQPPRSHHVAKDGQAYTELCRRWAAAGVKKRLG